MASRHFRHLPRPSPRWSMPRAPWFFSCGRATAPPVIRSPVHLPRHLRPAPQVHSRPSSSISRSRSCTYCHAFLCSRHSVSGEPRVVQPFILLAIRRKARRIRTPSGPAVHLHSLSAARRAYPDREWSRRSSSLAIRRQEGVSGPRVVQPFLFTRYPPPGRRLRIPGGPAVHLQSLSAARKASPGSRVVQPSISLAIRRQECVSGPRVVQPFIFTRHPPPGRRIRTAGGSGVHLHLLSASRKAFPDRDWSRRLSSLAIRRQEGVSRPRLVQAFIFTRYPPPGGRIRIPSGPGVRPHSLSASRKAYRDPEWSRRSSSLAIRRQEGVSGPPVVQAFVRTRYPPPERRIGTPSGPAVHIHSLSATGEALPDRDRSYRSSSLAIRRQEGAPRPREVQPFIFTRYPLPGRRIRTATGPGDYLHPLSAARKPHPDPSGPTVHLHSLSATRKAYPDPEWSRRSSALAIRLQKGVSGPRVVQSFIFTRCPLPGRRIRTLDGPAVHLHSLSASRKAYRDPEWSSRSSSLAIRCQEGVSGPRVVQPFIFTHYPPPGRRIRTPSGPGVHLHSLSAARKAYPDPEWSRRSSSLAIRRQEGVSGPRVVQAFIRTRYPPPERRIGTPSGPAVHLHLLSAARKAYRDPGWSSRSSSVTVRHREGVSRPRLVLPFIFTRYPPPGRRILTPSGPGVHLHSLSATRKAYPDPEWSRRSSALAIRLQKGVSGPRVVQSFIFTRSPLPGRRIRTLDGPAVHLHSLYASRKAYPDREWSSRSSLLATRRQEGVSGPRVVQPFIFTRYPPPGRRIRTPSGPGVHLHPLSAARKAYPDHERSRRLSSLAIRCQEAVSGPREVQPFIFTRYPPPGRRTGTPSGPSVHLQSLSAAKRAVPDRDWPGVHLRSSIRLQEGVYGPEGPTVLLNSPIRRSEDACGSRMVQSFSSARLSATR